MFLATNFALVTYVGNNSFHYDRKDYLKKITELNEVWQSAV